MHSLGVSEFSVYVSLESLSPNSSVLIVNTPMLLDKQVSFNDIPL